MKMDVISAVPSGGGLQAFLEGGMQETNTHCLNETQNISYHLGKGEEKCHAI
jgi:hypothetical protein